MNRSLRLAAAITLALSVVAPAFAQTSNDLRSIVEVRNTVVQLVEALLQKGVMTREQAQAMVAAAQTRAAEAEKARTDRDAAEAGAVRVTRVPELVKQEIAQQVSAEIRKDVTADVVAQAKSDGWGVPG